MDQTAPRFLDGNVAAGELSAIFVMDVTTATCQCNSCGKIAPFAEEYVYTMQPGLVVRCSGCENTLMRVVKGSGSAWIDMRGLEYVQLLNVTQ